MDKFLLDLLIKIENAEKNGDSYFYSYEESEDPRAEVSGLKELQRLGYISCEQFIPDHRRPGGYFVLGGPCHLEHRGRVALRDAHAQERTGSVQETCQVVGNAFSQTLEHLSQASKNLIDLEDERTRKDAVRDCLSAMESLLKSITSSKDIKEATSKLKSKKFGPELIAKDGLSIWDHIHRLYPDLRHGHTVQSTMSEQEALYWVDRITSFIRYITRVNKQS